MRSVAKAYGPDLRLAVLTGDGVTVDRVRGRQRLGPGWVSLLLQRAVARLWADGSVDPRTVAAAYGGRRDALIDALARRGVAAHGRSGMNVWVPVPDETGAVARLLHAGWAVAPGARFRMSAAPGVRITVSTLTAEETGRLADAVAAALGPPPSGATCSRGRCRSPFRGRAPYGVVRFVAARGRARSRAADFGLAWVSAAPASTTIAPTGVDQVSDSSRIATPAAAAMTGMKYVTICAVVGPTSATRPYWMSTASPVPSAPSAATASSARAGGGAEAR